MFVSFRQIMNEKRLKKMMDRYAGKRNQICQDSTVKTLLNSCRDSLRYVREEMKRLSGFKKMVLVGIGGSSLGARLLVEAFGRSERIVVLDNVDPDWLGWQLRRIGRKWTLCIVTKSGTTAETAAVSLLLLPKLRALYKGRWRNAITVITDPERGPLRRWARENRIRSLEVPSAVPGRYSVLTTVGLLPAAFCGVDVERVVAGACGVFGLVGEAAEEDVSWKAALCDFAHWRRRNVSVLFVYRGRLRRLCDWFAQLWAESLGKRLTEDGSQKPTGQTPLGAVGVTDQHSLLQLFAEGPDDKVYTLVVPSRTTSRLRIERNPGGPEEWGYLAGRSLWELFSAEATGTEATLIRERRPLLKIVLDGPPEEDVGALLAFFMMRTIYTAALLGVNPFNQPGVEYGKKVARKMLGGSG